MVIVGRKEEITSLELCFNSGKPEFIALYGRRRVGKTFLVEQMFGDKFRFYVTGVIDGKKEDEMTVFHNALKSAGYAGAKPDSWYDAFSILRQVLEKN